MNSKVNDIDSLLKTQSHLGRVLLLVFLVAVGFFVVYMRVPQPLNFVLACILTLFCLRYDVPNSLSFERLLHSWRERLLALVALGFGTGMILSYHIVYEDPQVQYYRLATECYFSPWSVFDVLAVAACAFTAFCVLQAARNFLLEYYSQDGSGSKSFSLPQHAFAIGSILLFICWIPWLITWWPGFIFSDTIHTFAFTPFDTIPEGYITLDSGLLYPLILGSAKQIAKLCGNEMLTFVLSSLFQMLVMALVLSHFTLWASEHAKPRWQFFLWAGLLALYAFDPYHAAYSIAHWKDPLFAMGMLELSMALADCLFVPEEARPLGPYLRLAVSAICVVLMRNNGQGVLAVCGLIMLGSAFILKQREHSNFSRIVRNAGAIFIATALACCTLMFVILPAFGGRWMPRERMGLRLAQVGRVAAIGGNLSEEDKEFLGSLLPLDEYATTYCPQWIDPLKWAMDGTEVIEEKLTSGFTEHWISIGLKNPKAYVGAWALQTTGFWAVNCAIANTYPSNFTGGDLHFEFDYSFLPVKNNPELLAWLQEIFPLNSHAFPTGWVLWLTLSAIALLISLKRSKEAMVLFPSATLLVGYALFSVISMWPRYALPGQLLLVLVPVFLFNKDAALIPGRHFSKGN